MKFCSLKWLKRIYALIAVKLFILAFLLTLSRIIFVRIDDYKIYAMQWLSSEYNVNLTFEDISAGIDFSGLILNVSGIELVDSVDLPYQFKLDHLFIYLNFWQSLSEQTLVFNRISAQGADITIKPTGKNNAKSESSSVTTAALQKILLVQLSKFSIKDSQLHFTDPLQRNKTVVIEKLNWINEEGRHQGRGYASMLNGLADNSLNFVVDLVGQNEPLAGHLYVAADNFNISHYLTAQVNPNAQLFDAVLGFKAWAEFSSNRLQKLQLQLNNTQLHWSQLGQDYLWKINSGLVQFTNTNDAWLLDSYNLDIESNQKKMQGLNVQGHGTAASAYFALDGVNIKDLMPLYLLRSDLQAKTINSLSAFDLNARLDDFSLFKNSADKLQFSAHLSQFKSEPQGAMPGISDAQIDVIGDLSKGKLNITLPKQSLTFDGQFSREMPLESAQLDLQWLQMPTGFKVFSEHTVLNTRDLNSTTAFSLFFPNQDQKNQSPFLSLYSYADLNDASKAQYYLPVKALGNKVFNYLQPTLKKGQVKGAKILWYGALNQYPYGQNNGIFQAWVPLRGSEYDFYGDWQGLTNLDLDILFENDGLTMNAHSASLQEVEVKKLTASIDHLNPNGILTVNAEITEDAQKISDYLKASPLKESVGKALSVIEVEKKLTGALTLTIPFNQKTQKSKTLGTIQLAKNNVNIKLAEDLILPLKNVRGEFSFINGNLMANNLQGQLFEQPIQISFNSEAQQDRYQVNADLSGNWDLMGLTDAQTILNPLKISGQLDWAAAINFDNFLASGYQYNVAFNSATRGVDIALPYPFEKNALQSWPTDIVVSGDQNSSTIEAKIKNTLWFSGIVDYREKHNNIPYFVLNIGTDNVSEIDKTKQVINVNLDNLNIASWYQKWVLFDKWRGKLKTQGKSSQRIKLDEINVSIQHADLFSQPLNNLKVRAVNDHKKWDMAVDSDNLQTAVELRNGEPMRLDFDIKKLNFHSLDLSNINADQGLDSNNQAQDRNLLKDYPEILVDCLECIYGDINLSPMRLHIFPNKKNLNINYIKIGNEKEFTEISGVWDQYKTNLIVKSVGNEVNDIVKRLGYSSPMIYSKAELSGALNWIGAPWSFNLDSLKGTFSAKLTDGAITEVNDNGARLLSLFSLDGIRRTLNNEFNNVFSKGLNFDQANFSGSITDGIVKNDDFYLNGSAGKISGKGLIDLPNNDTNYQISYSPAITSSLPVLTAFVISPLTGAAVFMLAKILEPVVETIIRVDFTVKGPLNSPEIKLINRKKGKVTLQNTEVLHAIEELKQKNAKS
ncbi:membrane protein-like protein [Psychromonas ingrahamii 37]|uniref:Membrane protein-like protein n=1 Tax=Psychromonas ingrahamii (strain DSM 17664 / CCUG 51855 / 37) TaxID=357804 RepID=A1STZ9_PSYIN|nr:YhdP family protein [Psychromonas ingrahamii]ABM02964.1 membrane protein-like protein [Psychromonas ingrahamii 37]